MPICILHILVTDAYGGAEKVVQGICENMPAQDFDFTILCAGGSLMETYAQAGLRVRALDMKRPGLQLLLKIKAIILEQGIQCIHAHDNRASVLAYLVKKLFGLELQIFSHVHSSYPWLKTWNAYRILDRCFRNRYDSTIFCSQKVFEYYRSFVQMPEQKYSILPNAIKAEPVEDALAKSIRVSLGYTHTDFVCAFAGRLTPAKGLIPFLEALTAWRKRLVGVRFLIIGKGELFASIAALIQERNLSDIVQLLGYTSNVTAHIRAADILILPSIFEGLPMVVLEAMSVERPVVAFDVGGIRELVAHGQTGYVIPPMDYAQLFESILNLKENAKKREQMGRHAKDKLLREFSMDTYSHRLAAIYHQQGKEGQ